MTKTITATHSGPVTAITPKTIVVFIPALDVEVDVQRNPDASVQTGSAPEVGDIATVQIVLENGDYAVTAATFVTRSCLTVWKRTAMHYIAAPILFPLSAALKSAWSLSSAKKPKASPMTNSWRLIRSCAGTTMILACLGL